MARLATLQKTSSHVCFYKSPRHNSSARLSSSGPASSFLSLRFFPSHEERRRRETVVTTDRRESGTQGFSQTCLLSLTLLSRAAQDICTPPFASILSHERRKNKEKERRRKRDKEREREKTASQGHNPLYTGRRRQGLSAGSRVSSLAASRNSGRKTGPFLGETRTTDTHVSPRKTNFHSCPADLTTRNPENPTEHRLKPLLPRPHGGRDEISTRTGGRRVRRSIEGVNRIPVAARASQILRVGETSFDPFFTPSTSIFLFVLGKFASLREATALASCCLEQYIPMSTTFPLLVYENN